MKISVFSAFYPFRGGIAQFNARLAQELAKENTLQLFTFKKQYPNFLFPGKSQFVESTVNPDPVEAKRIVSTFNPFTYFSAVRKIKQSDSELFITNYWMTFFGPFMGIIGKRLKGMKRMAIVHNLVPHEKRFFDSWFNRFFVKKYDGFIVLSEAVKNDILAIAPKAKVLILEHPLYDHFMPKMDQNQAQEQLNLHTNKKTLLFFGIIRDYKGLDNLILAMEQLSDDYQLIIAGEVYGDEQKYVELIEKSSKKESIFLFNQFIADDDVHLYFSAADLCVLPYRTATQSGVTAISHYFELPVLATNVGGLKETITHFKTGWIIEKSEPQQISEGISAFFSELKSEEIETALRELKDQRSWSNFATEIVAFSRLL